MYRGYSFVNGGPGMKGLTSFAQQLSVASGEVFLGAALITAPPGFQIWGPDPLPFYFSLLHLWH